MKREAWFAQPRKARAAFKADVMATMRQQADGQASD